MRSLSEARILLTSARICARCERVTVDRVDVYSEVEERSHRVDPDTVLYGIVLYRITDAGRVMTCILVVHC